MKKNPSYTALLGPTRLLISEKSVAYTINWSYTIIWQVRVLSWSNMDKNVLTLLNYGPFDRQNGQKDQNFHVGHLSISCKGCLISDSIFVWSNLPKNTEINVHQLRVDVQWFCPLFEDETKML